MTQARPEASTTTFAGTFARVLGRYVREQKALTLMDALAKMTLQPANRVGLKTKGRESYPVRSYRCEKCGYLEFYAREAKPE